MSFFRIRPGIAVMSGSDSGLLIIDETGRKVVTSSLFSELIGLIGRGVNDEDVFAAALEDRFPLRQVYYALIQLEKQGIIVKEAVPTESSADLFRAKVHGKEQIGYPFPRISVLAVCILAIGGSNSSADDLALSLARSEILRINR